MVNVMQQVGGAVGLAVLVAVYGTAYRDGQRASTGHPLSRVSALAQAHHVQAHGMATAFLLAAIFDVVSLIVIAAFIRSRAPMAPPPSPAEAEEEALAA
jgi:F0F1-type ATP synthase membrane subunit c/vacuolar-type H+-ATPase subunit K